MRTVHAVRSLPRADNLSEALYYSADYNDWALRDGFPYCSDSALLELYLKYAEGLGTNPITYEAFASINRCDDECVGNYLVYAEEAGSSAEPYSAAWVAFNCEPIPNPYPKQVIPLDIDDQGNIIGVFRRPYRGVVAEAVTGDEYVAVKWTRSYYGLERYYFYTATILEDGFGNDGAPVRTAQLSQMHEFSHRPAFLFSLQPRQQRLGPLQFLRRQGLGIGGHRDIRDRLGLGRRLIRHLHRPHGSVGPGLIHSDSHQAQAHQAPNQQSTDHLLPRSHHNSDLPPTA